MEQKAKFIIIGLIGVTLVCLFLFMQALGSKQGLARERDELKSENTILIAKVDQLTGSLRGYESKVSSLTDELGRVRQEKADIDKNYELVNRAREELVEKLKIQIEKGSLELEKRLQELQDEKASLVQKISELEAALEERLAQINSLQEKTGGAQADITFKAEKKDVVELPAIVVRPTTVPPESRESATATLIGKIIAVNRGENFVIIDLGEESGVKIGDNLRVYRSDKPIANIEVIQVRRNISACDIKKQGTAIKIGDTVR